jgi:4-hydroxybenzoate polyprenyltransferase
VVSVTRSPKLLALVQASHPGPCLVVTAVAVLLAVTAGASPGPEIWIFFSVSVLAGQLSIGWSNDYVDAPIDTASHRTGKPVAAGALRRSTVLVAALAALAVSFGLALVVGLATAVWLVPVVGGGWIYNLGLKATAWSGLAYVVGFAPLPGLAVSILPGHPLPRPWALVAAALLGLGAHYVNVLPDLATDRATGVRGLPQRTAEAGGELAVRAVAVVLLMGASALVAFAPGTPRRAPVAVGLAAAVLLGVVAVRARGRVPFRCAMAIAAIDVVMFALGGGDLTS